MHRVQAALLSILGALLLNLNINGYKGRLIRRDFFPTCPSKPLRPHLLEVQYLTVGPADGDARKEGYKESFDEGCHGFYLVEDSCSREIDVRDGIVQQDDVSHRSRIRILKEQRKLTTRPRIYS